MILTINNKNYELKFGLGFLAEMNKRKSAEIEGVATGYGSMALLQAGMYFSDPLALLDLIKAGTAECPQKPSNEDLEKYITDLAINGKIDNLFELIFEEIKKSPILAHAMKVNKEPLQTPTEQVTVTPTTIA